MNKTLITIITLLLALFDAGAFRQITVTGNIYDRRNAGHLPDTEIRILTPDSVLIARTIASKDIHEVYATAVKTVKTGGFSVELSDSINRYILIASHEGFEPHSETLDLSLPGKRQYELKLKPIYLSPAGKTTELDALMVKATKVKFYNKGDTIVYNADAFILPEGSMLDALLEQLPGVEFREGGKIFVNGKYVESLLLNGKDFFKGNQDVLRQNIGAYTVKNVEVYDKYNEMSTLMGRKIDGDSQYVMDVKLKKDYMGGFMGNAEIGGGTHGRYVGRLFGMYFNDHARFSAYLNLNNLNKRERPNSGEGYFGINTDYLGVNDVANGGFDYNVEDVGKVWSVGGNIDANYVDNRLRKDRMQESFLTGGNTFTSSFSEQRNYDFSLNTTHMFKLQKPLFYTRLIPTLTYSRHLHNDGSIDATFNENVQEQIDVDRGVLEAIYSGSSPKELKEALINRNRYYSENRGNVINGRISSENSFKFKNNPDALSIRLETSYQGSHDKTQGWQTIDYGNSTTAGPLSSMAQRNTLLGNPSYNFMISGSSIYYIYARKFTWSLGYEFHHEQKRRTAKRMMAEARAEHEEAFVPEAEELMPDLPNSNQSKQYDNVHKINGKMEYSHKSDNGLELRTAINAQYNIAGRRLDYNGYGSDNSGNIYPVFIPISRTTGGLSDTYFNLSMSKGNKGRLGLQYNINTLLPSLLEMVDLPNTSDPLNISLGNPDLKKATEQTLSFWSYLNFAKNSRVSFSLGGRYVSNDNTRGYRYESVTGTRIFKTYNTNGNCSLNPSLSFNLSFGPERQLDLDANTGYTFSRFANMIGEDTDPVKQKVYQNSYSARASLRWRRSRFFLRGGASIRESYSRSVTGKTHVSYLNPNFGGWARLPGNIEFSTNYSVYMKSGLADRAMNRTRHLLNADLTYTIKDISFSLKAHDILGSINNVDYYVDARGRTETITNELPRYFLFSISYKFNTKENK